MLYKFLTASLISIALMTPTAQASEITDLKGYAKYRTKITFHWKPKTNMFTVLFSTGCRSAHRAMKLIENFDVSFDQSERKMDIAGSYVFKTKPRTTKEARSKAGPADCMGSRSKKFDIENVEHGPYSVTLNGQPFLSLELVDMEQIFKFGRHKPSIQINQPK